MEIYLFRSLAQLVEALCYKAEGRGFDSRWCHWNFLIYDPSGRTVALCGTGGKGGRCVELTILSPSCADCIEIGEATLFGTLFCVLI